MRIVRLLAAVFVVAGASAAKAQDGVVDLDAVTVRTSGGAGGEAAGGPGDGEPAAAGTSASDFRAKGYVADTVPTATKTDTPIVRVPQSVSVVTEEQLDDRNVQTLQEAVNYTPGVRVGAFGLDPRFDAFYIRGLDATYTGIFRDGLREFNFGFATFDIEPYGLAGISILKGPAAGLYGSSNAGGIVDLRTKRPTVAPFREIEAQVGTNDRYQANFDASGPLGNSTSAFYRLTGVARKSDTDYPFADDDRLSIAPAFTYAPDADTSLTVLGELQRTKSGGSVAYYNENNRVTDLPFADPDFNDLDQHQGRIGFEFEQRLNETFVFRQKARYQAVDDVDAEYVFFAGAPVDDIIQRGTGTVRQTLKGVVSDSQMEARFDTGALKHTVLGGVDVSYAEFTDRQGFGSAPPISFSDPVYGAAIDRPPFSTATNQDQTQVGLYLQDEVRLDRFTLTLGGRKDWVESNTRNGTPDELGDEERQKDDAFSGRVGLSYLFDFGLAPYVSYSTSFSPVIGTTEDGEAFVPTEARQWEAGVKYDVPDLDALLTAAVFDIRQKNGVVVVPSEDLSTNISVQRGEIRSRGIELEATASITDSFDLTASYAYQEVTVEDGAPETIGRDVSSQPRHTFAIWGDYTIRSGVAEGLGFGAGVRASSSSYGDDANIFKNEARAFVDAAVHYDVPRVEGLRFQVNATNIFEEDAQVCTSGFCYKEPERSVIGSVRYRF
ncbi:TonB-dependent siderophore receptor [Aureimonas leprariae]|uniref:TonB-dependent siderophore receptor n=2 Tax=Plantimonas leprariae TaxID=2615207 RepID=A0A7V7PTL0_9HYPH|nr:TonB-dependent siderophore receptor [Aureimonas leprariae]